MTDYDAEAFDAYERAGWESIAGRFAERWSPITSKAIDALLDAAHVGQGSRVLDVGTGAGDAAGRAVERGAEATGIDVAASMVEIAARRHPEGTFVQASASELPFADDSFDAVVGNNVIQHVGEPTQAALQFRRVLAPGGRVALTNWDAAERSPFFAAVQGAVAAAEVPSPTEAPAGPSFFQFTDDAVFRALLEDAGFEAVAVDSLPIEIPVASGDELITALAEGTVRVGAALRAADDEQRDRMREELEKRLAEWRRGSGFAVPAPMKLASGTKPA
ncbi:MAG TPA: methyltransferase domain-containing protein [Gaiellaceae bacterium]|nr:methyltransferase domain-containing protein [Gaiellaceae bacterium]